MKFFSACAVWLLAALSLPLAAQHSVMAPHLLLGPADFVHLNALAKREPWAAKQREAILAQARAFPADYEKRFGLAGPEIPPEGGQWLHYYACPQTGTALVFHPPADHVCPDDGAVFHGYPFDQVVYMLRADALGRAALASALAFQLAGDRHAAQHAADILKGYADRYAGYPLHDNNGKPGPFGARVYSQTLDEAIWLIDMTWAYDLLQGSDVLTAMDRTHIETDLLRASAKVLGRGNGPTDNINSWMNAAIAAVGFELHDKALVEQAVDGPRGFRFQMKAFVVDGFWDEGAWGYQFYAMRALTRTAQMARRAGIDLWQQEPALAALYRSPTGVMFPSGDLPAFNDTKQTSLFAEANLYEIAFAATGDPLFSAIAFQGDRSSRDAFLFGSETLPVQQLPVLQSQVFPNAGYATLRAADGLTDVMKFGPHGGGHGHNDKLTHVLFANGRVQSVDPGTQLYGVPTHKTWDKQTVAHNTVVVDMQTQKQATGKLLSWQSTPQFTSVLADAGAVYPQAHLTRRLLLTPQYLLDISDAAGMDSAEHTFDWVTHNYGREDPLAGESASAPPGTSDGYQLLVDNYRATVDANFSARFQSADGSFVRVLLAATPGETAFRGLGPGPDLRVKQPYLLLRKVGQNARWVAVYSPSAQSDGALSVSVDGDRVTVHAAHWTDTIQLGEQVTYKRAVR